MMTNGHRKGRIFLSYPHPNNELFFGGEDGCFTCIIVFTCDSLFIRVLWYLIYMVPWVDLWCVIVGFPEHNPHGAKG